VTKQPKCLFVHVIEMKTKTSVKCI